MDTTRQATQGDEAETSVVYGTQLDDYLYFVTRDTALWYAYFFYACSVAATYGDFKRLVAAGVWEIMLQRFEWTDDGQPPDMDAPFNGGIDVPGATEGDWEFPPGQKLWMPQGVQDRFGYHAGSPVSGDHTLVLEMQHESGIVQAMEEHGYRCERDDRLICAAHGIEPKGGWDRMAEEFGWPSKPPW